MGLPYEDARAGSAALIEAERILRKFGCDNFGVMNDWGRGAVICAFTHQGRRVNIEASWRGYAEMWKRAHPLKGTSQKSRDQWDETAKQKGEKAVPSILRDWIKGQITAIECGVMPFDQAFLPHLILADGRRAVDAVTPLLLAGPGAPGGADRGGKK